MPHSARLNVMWLIIVHFNFRLLTFEFAGLSILFKIEFR